jgi:hypothetical protein
VRFLIFHRVSMFHISPGCPLPDDGAGPN